MIFSQLLRFITEPKKYIRIHSKFRRTSLCMICILLAASAILTENNTLGLNPIIIAILAYLIYIFILFIQSIITDFFAQLFKFKANSYLLFTWLGISLLPLSLNLPLNILSYRLPSSWYLLWDILALTIVCSVFYLQILSIKAIYGCSTKRSIIIYILPYLAIIGFILLFFILLSGLTLLFRLQ